MRDDADVEVVLDALELFGRRRALAAEPGDAGPLRFQIVAVELGKAWRSAIGSSSQRISKCSRMSLAVIGPAYQRWLRSRGDDTGSLELGQHFVGDGAADLVVFGEPALVEQEAAIGEAGGDGVLDIGIDVLPAVAAGELGFEFCRQLEAGGGEVEPHRGGARRPGSDSRGRPNSLTSPSSRSRRSAAPAGMRLALKARATLVSPSTSPIGSWPSAMCRRNTA